MVEKIEIERLEIGSTVAFLQLGLALMNEETHVTEAHMSTLFACLNAGEGVDSRVYFSPVKGQFLNLSPLSGLPLFAALYAFSKALCSRPYANSTREVLEKWVNGDARAVGLAMAVLKWGADFKSSLLPCAPQPSCAGASSPPATLAAGDFSMFDPKETACLLRGENPNGRIRAIETLRRIAVLDGTKIVPVLPALVDALAEESRDRILDVLTVAAQTGLDLNGIMPVLAGLLLDRDYYDSETVGQLYRCLIAATESGADISIAWPYIKLCMEEGDLQLRLLSAGAKKGLPVVCAIDCILSNLKIPIIPEPSDDPKLFSIKLQRAALALDILAAGTINGGLNCIQLDGEPS